VYCAHVGRAWDEAAVLVLALIVAACAAVLLQGMATEHVRAAIQLEQWLMEGAYNKVRQQSNSSVMLQLGRPLLGWGCHEGVMVRRLWHQSHAEPRRRCQGVSACVVALSVRGSSQWPLA
jgi:hypothetical protein